jgi:NAD(P)-dependent dehydrogenase (short-subunit alcohol dehydrogenase family)
MPTQTKTVLVTGAAGGVGRALVSRLDELGWRVFAGVRSREAGEQLARDARALTPIRLDVCDQDSIAEAQEEVARELGSQGLGGLINNAGIVVLGPIELIPLHALRRQLEVNVLGPIAVTQAFMPLLRAGGGRVINVSGASGQISVPMLSGSGSKAALEAFSDALRMELKHQGIAVSTIVPGDMETDLFHKADEARQRDGYVGSAETQRIYAQAIEAADQAMASSKKAPVDSAVAIIVKALTTRRPAARYFVGREAKAARVLRHLPTGLRDRLLLWNRGLKPGLFESATPQPAMERHGQRRRSASNG